jgi:hypothetical protein
VNNLANLVNNLANLVNNLVNLVNLKKNKKIKNKIIKFYFILIFGVYIKDKMVTTEWMKCVKDALKTIPKNTPNRLAAAMKKAKLTYKKGSSSSSHAVMKKTHRHRRSSHKGRRGRGSRKHHSRRKGHRGGSQVLLGSPYGNSNTDLQLSASNYSVD